MRSVGRSVKSLSDAQIGVCGGDNISVSMARMVLTVHNMIEAVSERAAPLIIIIIIITKRLTLCIYLGQVVKVP